MSQKPSGHVENNFTGGLKTEFTGLNFPENACTDADNVAFSLRGDVTRRPGIDVETNYGDHTIAESSLAITSYVWTNVGADGSTSLLVRQVGASLYFFSVSDATILSPTSNRYLTSVSLTSFATDSTNLPLSECQFSSGSGYLFVFSPYLDTVYCSYDAGTITANKITVSIRDFTGVPLPNQPIQARLTGLNSSYQYNLFNQGWTSDPAWSTTSATANSATIGSKVFTVASGLAITGGDQVIANGSIFGIPTCSMSGTVSSYVGTVLTLNITSVSSTSAAGDFWYIYTINSGLLDTWATAEGNYPSLGDVWWRFKNTSEVFDPATTQPNVTLNSGPAPKGFYILEAFNQDRSSVSGIPDLTAVRTSSRPRTGTWFQGRVWYAGADGSQSATGTAPKYTWSESIYFSQIIETPSQFGLCYQTNDPTSEDFADLLPSDGGVIVIQGSGTINKLFPVQNGLLVHAANGIWFVTGSQGIGFAANDYTVTKISAVQCLSGSSFVDVLGWPIFWNHEGIYKVSPDSKSGSLEVVNLCYGTILSLYGAIPLISKVYAKGDYSPIDYLIKWVFREDDESDISNRYNYDRVLNYNTANNTFYTYTVDTSTIPIRDIKYIKYSGGLTRPESTFKYMISHGTNSVTLAEENDETNWVDFNTLSSVNYDSYFITGYKLYGQATTSFQPVYFQVYSKADLATSYRIQGIWDFANSPNSGKYTTIQQIYNNLSRFGIVHRRHRIRGKGVSLQLKVLSTDGMPFHIIGWSSLETVNAGM